MLTHPLLLWSAGGALAGVWAMFLFLLLQEMTSRFGRDFTPVWIFLGCQFGGATVALAFKALLAG